MSDSSGRPPIALPDGTRLREEYRVGPVLGAGSFGITYQAEDEHLDTTVAIKEYYPRQIAGRTDATLEVRPHTDREADEFETGLQQFMEEGRTVARFDHPSVVDVNSYFEQNGTGYLVMDYYEGQPLADRLAEAGGRLPEEEAVGYISDILDGLGPVHDAGVLHRDIDPQNIYLRAEDNGQPGRRAILIDFGAAREAIGQKSQSLDVILKPGYAPPEQYRPNGNHGPWTDIYACAATLYKCLTGMKPPKAPERTEEDELIPPKELREGLSFETDLAVRKGLALAPEQRPQTARAFAELLGRTRTAEGQTKAPTQMGTATPTSSPPAAKNNGADRPPQSDTARDPSGALTESEDKPQEPSSFDETAFASAQPEERASTWSLAVLGGGIASLVGGTLVFSDAGPVQILSFFGTWIAVCAGLIGLFRQGERLMRPEGRAAISDWLLGEDFAERPSNWPKTFTGLFDAVFTESHLSWTCFWRSAVTSVLVVSLLTASFYGFGLTEGIPDGLERLAYGATILLMVNVSLDYVSLFETRWILGKMSQTRWMPSRLSYLGVDLILTVLCILLPVSVGRIFSVGAVPESPVHTSTFWINFLDRILLQVMWAFGLTLKEGVTPPRLYSIMLLSTLFTSVWVWLYVGAGLLLKALRPLLESLDWLKRLLDVESRPAETMGLLLVVVASVGFAVSAPFVL